MARIVGFSDAYDAMISDRPYRRGMPTEKAAAILTERAGLQWDPVLVPLFLTAIGLGSPEGYEQLSGSPRR